MKNIFKRKNNFLKNSYIIKALSVLLFLSFIFGFAYNQNKEILALEEITEEEKGRLLCGKEIPVGEAMEKAGELLIEIIEEMEKIKSNSLNLIEAHKEMEELAKNCNLDKCIPSCEQKPKYDDYGKLIGYECLPQPCEGNPCPDKEKIKELFAEITNLNKEIQGSKDKINKLTYKNQAQEDIRRKLNLSRSEFDKCYIPPADWERVVKGEKKGRILLNCEMVMGQNLPRETKTIVEGVPVCTSLHNWFCCY